MIGAFFNYVMTLCLVFSSANCEPGSYPSSDNSSICLPCEVGFYKENFGSDLCTACPATQTTKFTGSNSSDHCAGEPVIL